MGYELIYGFDDRGKFVMIIKLVIRIYLIIYLNEDLKIYKGLKYKVNCSLFVFLCDFLDCFLVIFLVFVFLVFFKMMIR